ncbi:MAG TPA: hypothetical protein VF885_00820 [Arthrobacter sp.]
MSIEHLDFHTIIEGTPDGELFPSAEAVTDAIRQVDEEHPGYRHSTSTEIRCTARACSQFMDIKVGKGHENAATEAYAAHRRNRVDALLAEWFPAPENEELGN